MNQLKRLDIFILLLIGLLVLLILFSNEIKLAWHGGAVKFESLIRKRYTMTIDMEVENKSALQQVNKILQERLISIDAKVEQASLDADQGRITYRISGVVDTSSALLLLSHQGKFGLYHTFEVSEVIAYIWAVNDKARLSAAKSRNKISAGSGQKEDSSIGEQFFGKRDESIAEEPASGQNPLFEVLYPNIPTSGSNATVGEGPMVGRSFIRDTAKVNAYIFSPEMDSIFPTDLKLMWGAFAMDQAKSILGLYAVRKSPLSDEKALMNRHIKDVYASADADEIPEIDLTMAPEGVEKWERMTREASYAEVNGKPVKKCIAITLDDRVYSAPKVQQVIKNGRSQITGIESMTEANAMVILIKSGELGVPVVVKKVMIY